MALPKGGIWRGKNPGNDALKMGAGGFFPLVPEILGRGWPLGWGLGVFCFPRRKGYSNPLVS